ncbi:sulfatase-like hydrolase/transferase [Luteolibacter algae]|uniref:Sulfatase-like hydrolase/transferase n=2 Tax=Luteolibacter algae TaxID=454151 RepID=A0ABW5D8D9_9BACT
MALLFASLTFGAAIAAERPNIIMLFADDISAREIPAYGSSTWSNPDSEDSNDLQYRAVTPALDQLAKEGCLIKNAWGATVCSPSRAMMMTGRYAHIHKWWHNGDIGKTKTKNGKFTQWTLYDSSPLQIGHIAQQAGYGTYWAGKTQMPGDLTKYGFDEGCFTPGNLEDTDNPFTDFKMYEKKVDGKKLLFNSDTDKQIDSYKQHGWYWAPHVRLMNREGKETFSWWPDDEESKKNFGLNTYGPDVELDFIFEYMERQRKEDKPFFIYHTSHLGHDAFDWFFPEINTKWPGAPIVKWDGEKYTRTEPNVTGDNGVYDTHDSITGPGIHNHVNYLDYQVWLYRNKLRELGIEDNTVFIFCADNGTSGYGKASPEKQKGTHIPMIIYAPGMVKHGPQDVLANLSDFLPTIADLVGVKIPDDYEINGESLVPFLFTDKPTHRDWIYAYRGDQQLIRGTKVMKDGYDKWFDVSKEPADLISFPEIKDWNSVGETHRAEREMLEKILPKFDVYEEAHDAPGVIVPPELNLTKAQKNAKNKKPNQKKNKKND